MKVKLCRQCGINEASKHSQICEDCEDENKEYLKFVEEKTNEGHSLHCIKRQFFGDGECECDLYEEGYDPYSWLD